MISKKYDLDCCLNYPREEFEENRLDYIQRKNNYKDKNRADKRVGLEKEDILERERKHYDLRTNPISKFQRERN